MGAPCTCICSPRPLTGRLEPAVYDPFCPERRHRICACTLREPTYRLH